ncbi:HET-domain-containing protein [Apiospora sp. TS-2023a]
MPAKPLAGTLPTLANATPPSPFSEWRIERHTENNGNYKLLLVSGGYSYDQSITPRNSYPKSSASGLDDHGSSTSSPGALGRATQWYSDCINKHPKCMSLSAAGNYMPTRLLDLSCGISKIRVILTKEEKPVPGYATLSHCWGGSNRSILLQGNLTQLRERIAPEYLSRTFREAIEVAGKLGIDYIWIDSLCIIQDSLDDWTRESSHMEDVYSHGLINIMATASTGSDGGLYRTRNPLDLRQCNITTRWPDETSKDISILHDYVWIDLVTTAPLNRRGWVLQEWVLSPRALHFGSNQLAWECHQLDGCEMYPEGLPDGILSTDNSLKITDPVEFDKFSQKWRPDAPECDATYELWARIVNLYGSSSVTKESDKLVALSGLAKRMKKVFASQYLAGLWLRDLPHQLLWVTYDRSHDVGEVYDTRPAQYRAPSWSWASVTTNILTPEKRPTNLAPIYVVIEEAQVQPSAGQDDTGQLIGGHIRLTGTPIAAELVQPADGVRGADLDLEVYGKTCYAAIIADAPVVARCVPVILLPILREGDDHNDWIRGLLLDAVEEKPQGWYRRFGTFSIGVKLTDAVDDILAQISDPALCDASLCLEESPGSIILI